jgi:DNA-binding protein H-NS
MAAINVDKLGLKELLDLEVRVRRAIAAARDRERADAKQELQALAEKRGFSVADLFGATRGVKGSKVAIKYRNKDNPSETWTGRGRQPKWLAAKLSKGAKLADFAI